MKYEENAAAAENPFDQLDGFDFDSEEEPALDLDDIFVDEGENEEEEEDGGGKLSLDDIFDDPSEIFGELDGVFGEPEDCAEDEPAYYLGRHPRGFFRLPWTEDMWSADVLVERADGNTPIFYGPLAEVADAVARIRKDSLPYFASLRGTPVTATNINAVYSLAASFPELEYDPCQFTTEELARLRVIQSYQREAAQREQDE